MCVAERVEYKLGTSACSCNWEIERIPTSALATWGPIFDPFLPGEATLSSDIALIANLLISVLPDPTAPLIVSQVMNLVFGEVCSPCNHDLILSSSLHVVIGVQSESKDMRSELLLDHIVAFPSRAVVDRTPVMLHDIVLQ